MAELFGAMGLAWEEAWGPGVCCLRGAALAEEAAWLAGIEAVVAQAPWRVMESPMGPMSVATTNAGAWGWHGDRQGYRYLEADPRTGAPWPPLPEAWVPLVVAWAEAAGFPGFLPDACLLNRYAPGAKMGMHQDRDELDFAWPIVSVSLGLSARFLWGGATRKAPVQRHALHHGDVVVFGGPARRAYHGVAPVKAGEHPDLGPWRVNLTFRRAR